MVGIHTHVGILIVQILSRYLSHSQSVPPFIVVILALVEYDPFLLKTNVDKTSEKVTKDPKRQELGKKSHEAYMKRLKEKILEDNQLSTPSPADRPIPSTSSSTGNSTPSTSPHTIRSNDTYIYSVGILAVLTIGVCVFFT